MQELHQLLDPHLVVNVFESEKSGAAMLKEFGSQKYEFCNNNVRFGFDKLVNSAAMAKRCKCFLS